jgi:phosphoglycerate dehydrogenase-like enzyme
MSTQSVKFQVFIVDSADVPHGDDTVEREILQDCADVQLLRLHTEEEFEAYAGRADIIILWHHLQITERTVNKLTKTRLIIRNGVGYDNVDIEAAAAAGIPVANVPDYGTEEVADHAIALTLLLIRQFKLLISDVANGNWEWRTALNCWRLRGRILGIVGCGRIGTAMALRAKALGLEVRFYDPYLSSGYEKAIGIQRMSTLEELLSTSDVISIHVPLNRETKHMIGIRELKLMKQSAYLINTARGPVVSCEALLEALSQGWIAGAGLDVLEDEPFGASALQRFPNCIVTPHSAFYSQESLIEMRQKSALLARDALRHGRFNNVVNRDGLKFRDTVLSPAEKKCETN